MCGCGCAKTVEAPKAMVPIGAHIVRVADMSCGHCVATITKVVQAKWPSAEVKVDLASKTVSVQGLSAGADVGAVILEAGFTPAS